jgi:hypothetical protein
MIMHDDAHSDDVTVNDYPVDVSWAIRVKATGRKRLEIGFDCELSTLSALIFLYIYWSSTSGLKGRK